MRIPVDRPLPSPGDRRGQLAVLTDKGFAALDTAARGHVAAVRELLFDQLTPAQVGQLGRSFRAKQFKKKALAGALFRAYRAIRDRLLAM